MDSPATPAQLAQREARREILRTHMLSLHLFMLVLGDEVAKKAVFAIHIARYGSQILMAAFTGPKNQIGYYYYYYYYLCPCTCDGAGRGYP